MRKKLLKFLALSLAFVLCVPTAGAARRGEEMVRVGLAYGSGALVGANLENNTGYGSGYRFSYFDEDLRFEELARCMCLRGAKVIFVPAAFNMTTGPAHWELLFRQRAVDNQCFTVGVSPARDEQGSYVAYGNSIAVDPWGAVLCRAGAEETTLYADLDVERLEAVRAQLPILSARRTDLYEVREK